MDLLMAFLALLGGSGEITEVSGVNSDFAIATTEGYSDPAEEYVTVVVDGVTYKIRYNYENGWAFVPSTNPPGPPHYEAKILVYKVDGKTLTEVGSEFSGQYVYGGCFDADPESHVKHALKIESENKEESP